MKVTKVVKVLRKTSIFGNVHDDALNVLAFSGTQSRYQQGEKIVQKGKSKGRALVVLSGNVEIYSNSSSPPMEGSVSTIIGELALLADRKSTVNVVAATDCEALCINRELFARVVAEFPEIATLLHQQLTQQMQAMTNDLKGLEAQLRLEPVSPSSRQILPSPGRGPKAGPRRAQRQ